MAVIFAFSHDSGSAETSGLVLRVLESGWELLGQGPADPVVLESVHVLVRKMGHMAEFGVLYLLAWRAWGSGWRVPLALCAGWAALDEWHQTFVPNRVGSPLDVLVDLAGASLAATALLSRVPGGESERL